MSEPNDAQRRLIRGTEGIYLVDAGPGTGKTFALTRRYVEIVDQPGVAPEDVLLVTFTRNAASEMKERVVTRSSYGMRALRDAPIQTFHSRAHDVLLEHGFDAPTHLGIDDRITRGTRVVEDDLIERAEFGTFLDRFTDDHPEYADLYRVIDAPGSLLGLLNELLAKGVFPTADGWYRDGEKHLDGDFEAFRSLFDDANRPRNDGNKQSELRAQLSGFGREKCYLPDAPSEFELRGDGKVIPDAWAAEAFREDRAHLTALVHDVYFGYVEYALSRNYLTFGMLQAFAYVMLCEDHALREALSFEYVMVDEFQDTSEIQFKLALLACGSDNLCVVGDWKQSIYGFQYAAVENIQSFEARLDRFTAELNADADRVSFEERSVERIELVENYRSTQTLLNLAEAGLVVPATGGDDVDAGAILDDVVSLHSNKDHEHTRIEAVRHEDEPEVLLTKIQSIVDNDDYTIEDDGERRTPELGDIAVLTRTKDFGRELLHTAEAHEVPMAYEGGIELFRTDQAKLVLAWLRILQGDNERGWATVLERAGYALDEIERLLDRDAYPEAMRVFKAELEALETVGSVAEQVLSRYGYDGTYADEVVETLQDAHDATTMTRGDLIRFIERGIAEGATREVSAPAGSNAVTVQTIHAAKGLEYPIVVLANMNRYKFPPSRGGNPVISFDDPVGLRQRAIFDDAHGHPHVYHNWRADVLRKCLPTEYDEERRLLYVAMTRAEHHLVFTAGERPNEFIKELPVEVVELEPAVEGGGRGETVQTTLDISIPLPEGPVGWNPHDLMTDDVFAETPEGRGTAFGVQVHEFAEAYARGASVEPSNADEEHVREFIDGLDGRLSVETEAYLPLQVDGDGVTLSGVVDLVHETEAGIWIYDFKTDQGHHAVPEYRKQLSVYYHVLAAQHPDTPVTAALFFTEDGDVVEIDPMSEGELTDLIRSVRSGAE
ncbi:MAG: UvrD-helicase domain-containing protein [Halobacteriales archaeon]